MKRFYKYALGVLLVTPMLASAAAELVTNGSFETDFQSNGTWNIYKNLTGWTGAPNIELRNNVAGIAYDGTNFIELDTFSNSSISQVLTGTPGLYELSFWYSARPGTGNTNDLSFTLDGSAPLTLLSGVSGERYHDWQNYSAIFSFDGNGLLTFSATGKSDSYGGSLDMISFTSVVPEPEIYAMTLIGLSLLGFTAFRRRNYQIYNQE
ncbi:PEP-CTERM sorting domain-containing protein [Nitrosomonas ureae]|uniref:PEP-CTERM protein-sorting domain-containing protein n=1 Tax=Nitrosomonas ureae TaxID=44577 RepID=A0A286A5U9_9PROT|nr:PEP-CTERM sorting domain-containing protein [Nitrosomonas ureae]SOD17260.1 PEP-CTERM protein-sorting domain-containing protein [Nitrosomonas ureae]